MILKSRRFLLLFASLAVAALAGLAASAFGSGASGRSYVQTNLVSDIPGLAAHTDPNLRNPWGTSAGPGLVRYITTEVIRNPAIGRSLARLAEQAGLTVRTATVFSPVIRDLETAEQLFGLSRTLSRAVRAGYLEDPADLGSGPFLASCTLFMVVADAP
jgi:hypothetical protein